MTVARPRAVRVLLAAVMAVIVVSAAASPALAYPPDPPPADTARTHLAALTVAAPANGDTYDRDAFKHWHTVEGACDTREMVLKRDGTDVQTDADCDAVSGEWYSVYDETSFTDSSDLDIDHIVPLSEAWQSGADSWTDSRRETFANDLTHAQLIAVSAHSNRTKGDDDPAEWKPANERVWCVYAREWIDVKYVYDLAVDTAEKSALSDMLGAC